MTDPRFICRREGHVASVGQLSGALVDYMTSFLCSCQRCGQIVSFSVDELRAVVRADAKATEGKVS